MIAVAFLPEDVDVLRAKNLCGGEKIHEIAPEPILREISEGAIRITLDKGSLRRERVSYEEKTEIDDNIKVLPKRSLHTRG